MTLRNPMERLAREICWQGFAIRDPKIVGATKAQYWQKLPEDTREFYRREARIFIGHLRGLPAVIIKAALAHGECVDQEKAK